MDLGIQAAFGFADYEFGGSWGSDTDSHFGCIIIDCILIYNIYL